MKLDTTTEYVATKDLANGMKKGQKFLAHRLSPAIRTELENRGLITKVLSKKELAAHCKELEKLFRPATKGATE